PPTLPPSQQSPLRQSGTTNERDMNLPDTQLRKIFSGIYADACLHEPVNMREFVDRFEGIREQVQAKPGTKCWNSIKLDKEFFSNALNLDYLLRVQRSYYDEL